MQVKKPSLTVVIPRPTSPLPSPSTTPKRSVLSHSPLPSKHFQIDSMRQQSPEPVNFYSDSPLFGAAYQASSDSDSD